MSPAFRVEGATHCVITAVACLCVACGDDALPVAPLAGDDLRLRFDLQSLGPIPYPADNGHNPERIALGRLLFFDPILSGEKDTACGTCHHPDFAFADGRQFSAGATGVGLGPARVMSFSRFSGDAIELGPRNSPTMFNTAYNADETGLPSSRGYQFFDGRVRGLEHQAWVPLSVRSEMRGDAYLGLNAAIAADASCSGSCHLREGYIIVDGDDPGELGEYVEEPTEYERQEQLGQSRQFLISHLRFGNYSNVSADSVLNRLRSIPEYVELFQRAFAEEANAGAAVIDSSTYVRAVAAYGRELVTANSPYDRYVRGEEGALSASQKRGLELFYTKAKYDNCHGGSMFSDFRFVVTGVPQAGLGKAVVDGDDTGREEHTRNHADRYAFRTLTLRNVELTSPYMHDGVFESLEEAVRFFNDGARPRHPDVSDDMLDPALGSPLDLSDSEIDDLVDFLRALTDPGTALDPFLLTVPIRVPSGLTPVFGDS